jgi:DNA-binding LacI/PurR family transcriptional regulator
VFVASDLMASGALSHLASRGIHVPRDIAVFGFDDSGVAETTDPPLSTVAQPVGEMAMRAGNMLRALLNDEVLTQDPLLFRARLALRESA